MSSIAFHKRAMEIFDQVCDLPATERSAQLSALCGEDATLRETVEGMLQQDQDTQRSHADLAEQLVATLHEGSTAALPESIGGYRILRRIGQGGMGVIYEAEQESPARRVALKVLAPAMLNSEMLKRFQRETHLLGQLQHPGIGQIYEAGLPEVHGRTCPFFAMELIEGLPLNEHADQAKLSHNQRLELLARVCDAVQYAHQKSIIHRDLKPANVLVVARQATDTAASRTRLTTDAIGLPKVLDFGIARVTEADTPHATLQTEAGQVMGTLAYMSPEQVHGNSLALDTRCDVYALGVMLYELLAGQRPHDLSGLSIPEAARHVEQVEPTSLGTHDPSLRGDIETIVARAMEKDRERRYNSPADLADDIRRFLADEPIEARPATTLYLMSRFAKRNRVLVAGVTATLTMLIVALCATIYGFLQAESRRAEAVASNDRLRSVVDYQSAMLDRLNGEAMGELLATYLREDLRAIASDEQWQTVDSVLSRFTPTTTAGRLLDAAIAQPALQALNREFADQPALQADLLNSMVDLYERLGMHTQAHVQAEAELQTRTELLGSEHPDTLYLQVRVGQLLRDTGKHEAAEQRLREILPTLQRVLGPDELVTLSAEQLLAELLTTRTRWEEAEALHRATVEKLLTNYGPDHPETIVAQRGLGTHLAEQRKFSEAIEMFQAVHARQMAQLGADDYETLDTLAQLAQIYNLANEPEKSLPLLTELADALTRLRGADHQRTLTLRYQQANALSRLGRLDEAASIVDDTLERARRVIGTDHPLTASILGAGNRLYLYKKDWARSEAYGREALEVAVRTQGPDSAKTLIARSNLVLLYLKSGKLQQAERDARLTLEAYQRVFGPAHARTTTQQRLLAKVLMAAGKLDEAADLLEALLVSPMRDAVSPAAVPSINSYLTTCLLGLNQPDAAVFVAEDLNVWTQTGTNPSLHARGWTWVARGLHQQGQYDDADRLFRRAEELYCQSGTQNSWSALLTTVYRQAEAYRTTPSPERAAQARAALAALHRINDNIPPEERTPILTEADEVVRAAGIPE